MISDKNLHLSDAQALTATAVSTDHMNLGSDIDIGPGSPLWLVVQSGAAPGGTSPTITISIETDDNSSFSSATTIYTHTTIAGANFALGKRVVIPMPFENEQYMRVRYTLGGTSPTFTVSAHLTAHEPPNWKAYPDAI